MLKHALSLPILFVLIETLNCKYHIGEGKFISPEFECYDTVHLVLIVGCMLALLLVSCFMLASLILYADEQIESPLPWAYCSRRLDVYRYMRQIYLCLMLSFFTSSEGLFLISLIGLILISCGCLYELFHQIHMNHMAIFYALSTSECLTLCISLLASSTLIIKSDLNNPIICAILFSVLILFVYFFSISKKQKLLLSKNIEDFKEVSEVETYSRVLINLSLSRKIEDKVTLHGIIAFHSSRCCRHFCHCHKLALLEEREMQELDNPYLQGYNLDKHQGGIPIKQIEAWNSELDHSMEIDTGKGETKQKVVLYKFLIEIITEWNESQEQKVRLKLLLAYLKLYCYDSSLPTIYELMCARESSPNFFEEYLIFRCLRQIEEKLIVKETGQQSSNKIDNLIGFQNILGYMQDNMQESLKLFIGFWKELLDESPNFQYIGNISHEISQLAITIRKQYTELIEINPTNLYCRMLYALFFKKIFQDEYEAFDAFEKINSTANNLRILNAYSEEEKYNLNSKTSLFILSGEKETLGEVLSINNEVNEMLGYDKKDILGYNISRLMNPALASVHSQFILNFYLSGAPVKNTESVIFPLHKLGYMVPCTYLHHTSPSLSQGLQLIGFIHTIKEFNDYTPLADKNVTPDEVAIFLTDAQFGLHAFNLRAARLLGVNPVLSNIKKFLLNEEKISLKKLIPDLDSTIFLENSQSPAIAQTSLNLKKIISIIESELECLQQHQYIEQNEQFSTLLPSDEETKCVLLTPLDDKITAPLSYINLKYGKYSNHQIPVIEFKLVMIYLDLDEEKNFSNENEIEKKIIDLKKGKKRQDFVFDEIISQSQSSHSSTNSSSSEKKSVCNFKEQIKTQDNPFFVRCFRKLGFIIFLIILGSSVMDFAFLRFHLRLLSQSYENAEFIYKRLNYFMAIPNTFRTLYQIYLGKEPNESDIYSDRTKVYLNYLEITLEKLRKTSNQIHAMDHSFSESHLSILNNPVIQFIQKPDTQSISNQLSYTYQPLLLAINKYIAMGTQIKTYNSAFLSSGAASASSDTNYTLDRLMSYMISNGKGSLRYYLFKSQDYFYDEMASSINSSERMILVSLIVTPILITFLMMLFIPFIIKVQSNLLKIFLHLCQFSSEDLNKWLEECNNSAPIINASISSIRKFFASENFEIKIIDYSNAIPAYKAEQPKETTMESMNNNTSTTENNPEDQSEEESEELVHSIESISERKQKMFSSMTHEKTRVYLFFLLCFIFFIGLFRSLDGLAYYNITHETEMRQYIYHLMSDRSLSGISTQFFIREQYYEQILQSDIDHTYLTEYVINLAFDSEMKTSCIRTKLTGHFVNLKHYLNSVDTSKNCFYLFKSESEIAKCNKVYQGLIPIGYNSVILHAIIFAHKLDGLFRNNGSVDSNFASSFQFVKMNDVRTEYGELIFDNSYKTLNALMKDWFEEKTLIQNIKFSCFLILFFFIFILLWRKMVSSMQMDIIKALGILNILPISHLNSQPEFIEEIIKSNLIEQC